MGVPIRHFFSAHAAASHVNAMARLTRLGADLDAAIAIAEVATTLAEEHGASGRALAILKKSLSEVKKSRKECAQK